jgi:hypothetical protein
VTRVLTLVANSKMGEMTLSILTAEGLRNWVDTCAEIAAAVGDGRVERIRHQCQCWVRAYLTANFAIVSESGRPQSA